MNNESVSGERLNLSARQLARFSRAIEHFPDLKILVVGDLMLDQFIWGEVRRISPEAPVPVVEVCEETQRLGGSANVAANVAALGGRILVAGIAGDDPAARSLEGMLRQIGDDCNGILHDPVRPTTIKTRVIAHHQQVVRFDRENRAPISGDTFHRLLALLEAEAERVDAIIVSDYGKGVVTGEMMDRIRALRAAKSLPVLVDPKVQNAPLYGRTTLITPNHQEAAGMAGIPISDERSLEAAGRSLLESLRCDRVLITRGKQGMSLFEPDGPTIHIPTLARRVFDVTGAGDTVIASMALATAAGLPARDAALLANIAAGIVVGEVGTAAVAAEQLLQTLRSGGLP